MNERDVGEDRCRPSKGCKYLRLTRCIGQMVVAPNDVTDAHIVVVDDDRQHVGRRPVASQKHKVIELFVRDHHAALHFVLDDRFPVARRFETDGGRNALRCIARVTVAPGSIIDGRPSFSPCALAHLGEFLRCAVAAISTAAGQQLFDSFAVTIGPLVLVDRLVIPIEPEPLKPLKDRIDCFRR